MLLTGAVLWFWQCPRSKFSSDIGRESSVSSSHISSSFDQKVSEQFQLLILSRGWRLLAFYILIPMFLYIYLYDGQSIHGPVDLFHEGERLAPLNALLRGGIPFRDIYIQHGLFQNVGKAWLASLFGGPSLASLRLTERFIVPLGYIAIYLLGLQVFRFWGTAVVFVLITSSQDFWTSDRHAIGLLIVAILAYALR